MTAVTLITVYHFNSSNTEAYERLLRSLDSSIQQLRGNDRLILVANGICDGAEDPDQVVSDVSPSHPERVVPVVRQHNASAAGGLNEGVAKALKYPSDWIGQVQSSVVIGACWLEAMRSQASASAAHGYCGRLVWEDQPRTVCSDGHYLKEGRTFNIHYNQPLNKLGDAPHPWTFPCLSAALFSAETVRSVHEKYGDFVTERLSYYGDCTDVALRCAAVGCRDFLQVPEAVGTKRRRELERDKVVCSQLLAARSYYGIRRFEEARRRLEESSRDAPFLRDAMSRLSKLESAPYSPNGQPPPVASSAEDQEWGYP